MRNRAGFGVGVAAGLMLLALTAGGALADAIDGEWCDGTASFRIEGSNIRTPGGQDSTGNYSRHAFSYVVPEGEEQAGTQLDMTLLSDDMLEVYRRGSKDPKIWRRCKPVS